MPGTIDDRYFEWLYESVGAVRNRNPSRSYWNLARALYMKEFVWLVANDDNRVEDGKDLRLEFINEVGTDEIDSEWMDLGCSMLEIMIALSRRASFEYDSKEPGDWFRLLLKNAGIEYNDQQWNERTARKVDAALDRIIYRTYAPDGTGGFFPLDDTPNDQRKVELWYQMAEYLLEEFPLL